MKAQMLATLLLVASVGLASADTAITLTLSGATNGTTSPVLGVNLGQRYDGETSWTAFLRHSGVNGARLFGMNGLPAGATFNVTNTYSAPGTYGSQAQQANFGNDFFNNPVGNQSAFFAAVNLLHSSDYRGRNASNPRNFTFPAPWNAYYGNMLVIDNSTADTQSQGSPAGNLAALRMLNIQPLSVHWLTCSVLTWQTTDPTNPTYWAERWEVYKYQYVLATWSWSNGVARIEYWNEPDLNAACINGVTFLEHMTLRSLAIKHAYADANADVAAKVIPCPTGLACPFNVQVVTSAFAKDTFGTLGTAASAIPAGTAGLAALAFSNQNLTFPPQSKQTNASTINSDVLSFHSYGKMGKELLTTAKTWASSLPPASSSVPVIITEHQSHDNAAWDTLPSNTDSPFEGSRYANEVIATVVNGFDAYTFKFSTTPSASGGVTKSGLHFADVTGSPSATPGLYPVGDTTYSGEVLATIAPAIAGSKLLGTCAASTTVQDSFLCAVTKAGNVFYVVASNDISGIADSWTTGNPTGDNAVMTINTTGLGASSSSVAIVTEVSTSSSASYLGEVSLFTALPATLSKTLPPFGVMRMTVPANAQTITNITSTVTATVKAGTNAGTNFASTLTVGTSNTPTQDTTSVGLVQFSLASNTKPAASANAVLLELTVTTAPTTASVLHVIGLNPCTATNWTKTNITWTGAPWGLTVPSGNITAIRNNFALMSGAQPGNNFLGHISVGTGDVNAVKRLDVTQFVANAAQGGATSVSFMIVRRFRSDGICTLSNCTNLGCKNGVCTGAKGNTAGGAPPDNLSNGAMVTFASDTASTGAPVLRVVADSTVTGSLSAPTITGYCTGGPASSTGGPAGSTAGSTAPAGTTAISGAHNLVGYNASSFGTAEAGGFKKVLAAATGASASSVYITSVMNTPAGRHLLQSSVTVAYTVLVSSSSNLTAATSAIGGITAVSLQSAGLTQCTSVAVAVAATQATATVIPADVVANLPTTNFPSPPPPPPSPPFPPPLTAMGTPASSAVGGAVSVSSIAVALAAVAMAL